MATQKEADLALAYHQEELFKNTNLAYLAVVEVKNELGESTKEYCLQAGVYNIELQEDVKNKASLENNTLKAVPNTLKIPSNQNFKTLTNQDVEVDIQESKGFSTKSFVKRERPSRGGISISNFRYNNAGTLGAAFKIKNNKGIFILSNWHVIAGVKGKLGDHILQPGVQDGGIDPNDYIANLYWRGLTKKMDAAIAEIKIPTNGLIARHTKCFGPLSGLQTAKVNMSVKKCGRTTRFTTGKIISINASGWVKGNYPNGKFFFTNQIITTIMSKGGDSGSLLANQSNNKVVGLIFAGDGTTFTLANHIRFILNGNLTVFDSKDNTDIQEQSLEFDGFL